MIGGIDILFPRIPGAATAMHLCLRVIRKHWPQAAVEDAVTGRRSPAAEMDFPTSGCTEAFIYVDEETARRWDQEGAVPELANTMIHVLISEQSMTLAVDDPQSSPVADILESIRAALRKYEKGRQARV